MDVIKVCDCCKGDGFYRCARNDVHPLTNIAYAVAIYANGHRFPAVGSVIHPLDEPTFYEFVCNQCSGRGDIQWTRGRSLPPIVSRAL